MALEDEDPPDRTARKSIMLGFGAIILFFGVFGAWAVTADISSAVVAPGIVKVEGNRQTIQHLDGGVIAELPVKEGGLVQAGQVVLRLDRGAALANVDSLQSQLDALQVLRARLVAESLDKPGINYDPELLVRAQREPSVRQFIDSQSTQFVARRQALQGKIEILRQKISEYRSSITGIQSQLRAQRVQARIIGEQVRDANELFRQGFATKTRVLELQRQAAATEGSIADLVSSEARFSSQINENELQIAQAVKERQTEVAEQLRDTESRAYDIEPRLIAAKNILSHVELTAPITGYVVGLSVFTVGGVINRGDRIMDIVPIDSPLVVEIRVQPRDADQLRPGMPARIELTSIRDFKTPVVGGIVTKISADRLTDQRTGLDYFTVVAEIDREQLRGLNFVLIPGMPVDVMIPLQGRTLAQYLLGPIQSALTRTFRER